MKSLKFRRLVLVSDTTRSANQFQFKERFNLVTGKNNSIGKSSLIKNLFWAMGCESDFDETWKAFDCKALVEFSIGSNIIKILRTGNSIIFSDDNRNYFRFGKISGAYSEVFSELVGFKAKLPKRGDNPILDVPPPAYYFLPFYIDQLRSWTTPWNSFQNLGMYERWKQPIIKYHTGYLSAEHFSIEESIFEYEVEKKEADEEVKKIDTAIEIVEKYIPKNDLAITEEEFDKITKDISEELSFLANKQEELLNKLSNAQSSKYHLENQLEIAKRAVQEIEKDYLFSIENIEGDELECPLCGTMHDNSLISRAAILSDKQQAEDQVSLIQKDIFLQQKEIENLQPNLERTRKRIAELNEKYSKSNYTKSDYKLTDIVDGFASQSVQKNVKESKVQKQALYKDRSDKQADLKKQQKQLLLKNRREELNDTFTGFLTEFITKLNAKGVNLNKVKQPTDYNKLFGSGGAAEGTRAVLAYQIAIFRLICISLNETPAPLVIDTPNQQEQADQHYEVIIKLIMNDIPGDSQIILCAMDNEQLTPYKNEAHTIQLDDDKILNKEKYSALNDELSMILQHAKN